MRGLRGIMKQMWWMWILMFLLGIGAGKGVQTQQETENYLESVVPATEQSVIQDTTAPCEDAYDLPCAFPYTALVARELTAYDGPSLEDGAEVTREGVAALVLENTGTVGIEFARIILVQNNQELCFDATYIPPRAKVLILEKNGMPYSDLPVEECRVRTVIPGSYDWAKDRIGIEEHGLGSLAVTNLTDQPIRCTRVFYKQHHGETDLYIGGITFSAVLNDLLPGETRVITPYRYACGYSAIVAVVTE